MEYGSMSIHRLQSGRWLNWGIRFFLTAALTASQTAGGYAPFALGCIAAAGPGADGAAALLGGVTGALLFLDFQQVLALAAVGILILTAATAFRDTAFLQKPWVLPVLAAGMVLAVGGIYVLQSLDPLSHAAPCAAASALTGVSAHFFTRLFQPEEDRLAPYFDSVVLSSVCHLRKPGAEIYHIAARELGVDLADCVSVADNIKRDIPGAKAAGIGCNIIFRSPEKKHPVEFTEETRPDAVIDTFPELLELLPPLK